MSESSDKSELKGGKEHLKRNRSGGRSEHIEANVKIIDGCDGAKTDSHGLQELAVTLRQGFTQMSQDLSKTIAESFKHFQSEFEIQYVDTAEEKQGAIPQTTENDHEDTEEPPAKKKREDKTTSLEEAVTKLADSAGAQKTPSDEGKFEVLNSLKQDLQEEETGPSVNKELANVVNAMLKEGLTEENFRKSCRMELI